MSAVVSSSALLLSGAAATARPTTKRSDVTRHASSVPGRTARPRASASSTLTSASSTRHGAFAASTATLADEVRADFPLLELVIPDSGKQLVYLDNAASSQTPTEVVEAHEAFHRQFCANVHRGVHFLSGKATDKYEAARQKVRARG